MHPPLYIFRLKRTAAICTLLALVGWFGLGYEREEEEEEHELPPSSEYFVLLVSLSMEFS